MKFIKLISKKYKNLVAIVDDEDYEYLNKFQWYAEKRFDRYYARRFTNSNGKIIRKYMHKDIIKTTKDIDHINRNGLDNQKANLRICSRSENNMNRIKSKNKSSSYKGVCFNNKRFPSPWRTYINIHSKRIVLGYFKSEIEAAKVYDKKAKELFGEFAKLNFLEE